MIKKIQMIVIIIFLLSCTQKHNDEEIYKIVNYFKNNTKLLNELKGIEINSRGKDTFIYTVDSINIGFYLIDFDKDKPNNLQISPNIHSYIDSILNLRNINDISEYKQSLVSNAFNQLKLMDSLSIKTMNNYSYNYGHITEFITEDNIIINYCVNAKKELDKKFGRNINIIDSNWVYSYDIR